MASGGKSGYLESGENMPQGFFEKKMEQTCLFEDPNQLYDYYRASLRDIRPDAPTFESDMPRRNNYSQDRLNLRFTGARVSTVPDLPDGTFLEFDGLQRDPRGTTTDPNFMSYRRQQEARGKFIPMSYDDDMSVPSGGGRAPARVIADINDNFYAVKNRLKIFDDSMGNINTGGIGNRKQYNTAECMQEFDGVAPEIRDEICYTRSSNVNKLSNDTSIGWRRTTDNRFQIAHYGQVRKMMAPDKENVVKNKSNTHIGHDIQVNWQDQNVSKSLALEMIDLSRRKQMDIERGKSVIFPSIEVMQRNLGRKLTPEDLVGFNRLNVNHSQDATANANLNGQMTSHVTGRSTRPMLDSNRMKKLVINPHILTFMASTNKKMTPREVKDLRNEIKQGIAYEGLLLQQQGNKTKGATKFDNELLWDSLANFERGKSMKLANYKKMVQMTQTDRNMMDYEEYKKEQKHAQMRKQNLGVPDLYNPDAADYDQEVTGLEYVTARMSGPLSNKYMNAYIDKGDTDNIELNEITART